MPTHYDVAILGNGVLGYSTALAITLRRPDLRVAVVGLHSRGAAASTAAGAMLNSFGEISTSTFATPAAKAKFALNHAASLRWSRWMETLAEHTPAGSSLQTATGTYVLLNSRSGGVDEANFAEMRDALVRYDEPHEVVDATDVPGLSCVPDHRPLKALWLPREGAVDSAVLLAALQKAATTQGAVSTVDAEVTRLSVTGDALTHITLSNGAQVWADRFVMATGAYTQRLVDQLGDEVAAAMPAILAGRGAALVVDLPEPVPAVLRTPTRSGGCGLHAVPRSDGLLYIGATNEVTPTPSNRPIMGAAHMLLDNAFSQLNRHLVGCDIHAWHVGNRPFSLDGYPLIGRSPLANLWMLTGTYRDGLHCSPLLAEHTANLVLDEPGLPEVDPCFDPVRPLIQTFDRNAAITESVRHRISGSYEHNGSLPAFLGDRDLGQLFSHQFDSLYERLQTDFGLSPELVSMCMTTDDGVIDWLRHQLSRRTHAPAATLASVATR